MEKLKEFRGFAFYLDRTLKTIQNRYLTEFKAAGIEITIEQWVIMLWINVLGDEASQADIARTNYRNRATTSRVISGLCNKGLVVKERFPNDQKRFKLSMTEKGKELFDKAYPINERLRNLGFDAVPKEEFEVFMKVVDMLFVAYHDGEDITA